MEKGKGLIRFNAPVVLSFVFICLIAYLASIITQSQSNTLLFSVYKGSLLDPLFYVRFLGHVFGHANWAHLSGNLMYLLLLGPLLEEKYGSWNLAMVILLTAVVTGLIHIFISNAALLGASGVVFAFIILSSITSVKNKQIPLTFILVVVIYIGGQLVDGIFVKDQVSNVTHIIGGMVGGCCGYALNLRKVR